MSVATPPNAALERLNQLMAQLAHRFLVEMGQFAPFAGAIKSDGSVVSIALDAEWEASPEEQIEALASQLDVGLFAGGAVAADVRVTPPGSEEPTDAVQVIIETRSGLAKHALLPYRIDDAGIHYGKAIWGKASRRIFVGRTEEEAGRFKVRCEEFEP
jgi:hypothetical protein